MAKKGYKQTKEHIEKRICSGKKNGMFGKKHSEKTKELMRESKREKPPWNKGLSKETDERLMKYSKLLKNRVFTKEWCKRIRDAKIGTKPSKETREKMRKARLGKPSGLNQERENNGNWKGGISFEPYTLEFNKKLKQQIRERDNNICQFPSCSFIDHRALSVHHIDYNKENCELENLVSLCNKHNASVNGNRRYWQSYFEELVQ